MKRAFMLVLTGGLAFGFGCTEKSSMGFRLPDGNPEVGQTLFVDLQCTSCHRAFGFDQWKPVADPPAPTLGGRHGWTDGELVTSIINPSHRLSVGRPLGATDFSYEHTEVSSDGVSRMGSFNDVITIQELVDLVAFLHTLEPGARPVPRIAFAR